MKNIAIIGGGNIGRRHLQALARLDNKYTLFLVDPFSEALELALKMYKEVKSDGSPELHLTDEINELPRKLFTGIISTNSKERFTVTKILLKKNIRHIIFEKILFQNASDYHEIDSIMKERNITAFVNCRYRADPFYKELRKNYKDLKLLSFSVKGNNWGIASNTIHFIDLLNFFTGYTDYQFMDSNVRVVKSNRNTYYELEGIIKGDFGKDSIPFLFESNNYIDKNESEITIEFNNSFLTINDEEGWWVETFPDANDNKGEKSPYLQSEMTHIHIMDLSERSTCSLTHYPDSCKMHLPMITYFNGIFKKNGISGCPIT